MKKEVSVYLDLIRVVAAIAVFLSHFGIWARVPRLIGTYAHPAVIAFFVISGYVIAYVSTERETDLTSYTISRTTRIYSVAIPALIITAAVDIFLQNKGLVIGRPYQLSKPWKYVPLFLAFGTDWWILKEDAFSNVPYWSLCYEVWYYVLFASYRYFTGHKRLLLCGAILLLVGPRLWLLLPIWLSGVWLYDAHAHATWRRGAARAVWGITLVGLALLLFGGLYGAINDSLSLIIGDDIHQNMRYSGFFMGDYVFTSFIILNIYAISSCDCAFYLNYFNKPIRYMATLTFSLYLFHYPLLELFSQWLTPLPLAIAVLVAVWSLTRMTEWLRVAVRSRAAMILLPSKAEMHSR